MQVFETTVKVFIHGDDPVDLETLKDTLSSIVFIDIDTEDDDCDVSSLEVDWDELKPCKEEV